jgi:hypothetical protein
MKYKDVIEGFENTPDQHRGGMKTFLKNNKYVVGGVTVAVVAGVVYYLYSKKKRT